MHMDLSDIFAPNYAVLVIFAAWYVTPLKFVRH